MNSIFTPGITVPNPPFKRSDMDPNEPEYLLRPEGGFGTTIILWPKRRASLRSKPLYTVGLTGTKLAHQTRAAAARGIS
jgi:hypothetical protein